MIKKHTDRIKKLRERDDQLIERYKALNITYLQAIEKGTAIGVNVAEVFKDYVDSYFGFKKVELLKLNEN